MPIITFDFDGVLFNPWAANLGMLEGLCQAYSKKSPFKTVEDYVTCLKADGWPDVYKQCGFTDDDMPTIWEEFVDCFTRNELPPYADALAALQNFGDCIISGNHGDVIRWQLAQQYVSPVRIHDHQTPKEEAFRHEADGDLLVYVTDCVNDVAVLKGVGQGQPVMAVGAGWGLYTEDELQEAGADVTLASDDRLPDFLETL